MPDALDKVEADVVDEARVIMFPALPVQVNVPPIVWVVPLVKVTVCGAVSVKLLKLVEPETVCEAPLKVTVPELCVNVPSVYVQLPATERVPDVEVKVPLDRVKLLATA